MLLGVIAAHGFDLLRVGHAGGPAGELLAGLRVEALQGFFDAGNGGSDHTEFIDPQSEEQRG